LWKRATGLLLSSALIFSLAACTSGGTGDTNTKQAGRLRVAPGE
jgi:hypothetical protein